MSGQNENPEELQEYEVLEMESDDGEVIEFVVLDHLNHENKEYVLLMPLERAQAISAMEQNDWDAQRDEFEGVLIMRIEDDQYVELNEEEMDALQPVLDTLFNAED